MNLFHCRGPAPPLMITMYNPGRCAVCGCTEQEPCDFHRRRPLWWVDVEHTICAAPRCFKVYPRILRERLLHR